MNAYDPPRASRQVIRSTRPGFAEMLHTRSVRAPAAEPEPVADIRTLIAAAFDPVYYVQQYDDVRQSAMDPLEHFLLHGADELRNPAAWFDTGYYLRANTDVADAELNPFWHYLAHGRAEGRQPASPHNMERAVLARALPPNERWAGPPADDVPHVAIDALRAAVLACAQGAAGLTIAISHDRYTDHVGGVQIVVGDEQAAFNRAGEAYLHIAPAVPRLTLALPGQEPAIHLTIDGSYAGITSYDALAQVTAELAADLPPTRRLVVHCLLGHAVDPLITLHYAMRPATAVFWINDYEAVCVGYNLLRNDVAFCGGPPPGSLACRICVYGEERGRHLVELGRLFAAIPFHVVAPSQAALQVWAAAAKLPHASAQVHEYIRIRPTVIRNSLLGATPRGTPDNPVRIGFVGYDTPHKGWPGFAQVVAAIAGIPGYKAFHFAVGPANVPLLNVETIAVSVTPGARDAMTDALIAQSIDLVLVLSTWPETFCLVAYEATAAGADVIALVDSGNVAEMVVATGRGLVMPDVAAVVEFFTSGVAVDYVRMCGKQGSGMGRIESRGMTSTLPAMPAQA